MAKLEKTNTPGIYKQVGKTKTSYVVMYSVRIADPEAKSGWKWKPKGQTLPTYDAARSFKVIHDAENRKGQNLEPTDLTVEQLAKEYLEYMQPSLKIQTFISYETHVNKYITSSLGQYKAAQLMPAVIRAAGVEWDKGVRCRGKSKSGGWKVVNGVFATINRIYKFALTEHDFKDNPMDKVKRLKRQTKRTKVIDKTFSAAELQKILQAAEPGLERTFLMTTMLTGLRPGEMCGLRWSEVDLKEGTLTVSKSMTNLSKKHGGPRLEDPKTEHAHRSIGLVPELVGELRRWKVQSPPNVDDLVFVTVFGKPVKNHNGNAMLRKCCRRAQVKELSLHKLRHSFASQHVLSGTSLPEISKMIGHANPGFTLSTYVSWTSSEKSNSQTVLANRILHAEDEQEGEEKVGG